MLLFFVASASGWLLVALTATTVALPFVFRPGAIGRALGLATAKSVPFLRRMRPHYLSAAKRPLSLARGMHGLSVFSPLGEKRDLYGRSNGASRRRSTVQ